MPLSPPFVLNDLADTEDFAELSALETEIFALFKVIVSMPVSFALPVVPFVV